MNKLHYIDQQYAVLADSIHDLDIGSSDTDEQGYLLSNGTNRGLSVGRTEDGDLLLYMTTNGDDAILHDTNAHDFAASLGTNYDVQIGKGMMILAVEMLREEYPDDKDDIDWIEEQIDSI